VQAARDCDRLADLVERDHPRLSVRAQCLLLGVTRSNLYYETAPPPEEEIKLCLLLDQLYLEDPCLGSRRLPTVVEREIGLVVNRKRIQRLRREMGLEAIYCRPRTSQPGEGHRIYPYLLRDLRIERPDEVWCADITYIPMDGGGHAYLCAVMDWHSRKVLGWEISNTMDVRLCLAAFDQACTQTGKLPGIFNTDQGCQFTSEAWIARLESLGIRVSMDGRGRWMDNIFIERLWRSVKYESIYITSCRTIHEQRESLAKWFTRYNEWRPHATLENRTPAAVYSDRRQGEDGKYFERRVA
jgi:putative transposase